MSATLLDRLLARYIVNGRLDVIYADGRRAHFGQPAPGYPEVAIRLADKRVPRDIALSPSLGTGEAYMDGRIELERGDITELVELVQANSPWEQGLDIADATLFRRIRDRALHLIHSFNKPGSARRNVSHHYDIGNTLYRLMLDQEHMQYSCAYWLREGMTLGEAQEAKLAHIAAKLALKPGQRVLDIGCGWGGMAVYLAQKTGVEVLGITLSKEQLALAYERAEKAGVGDKVRFELADYRELAARALKFDRIVSVGMFEHVGVPQYETFFRACADLLTDDGVMLVHTIGRMGGPDRTDPFTAKYIFPGGYIPALCEVTTASEKVRLVLTDLEVLRLHYAKTLREWYRRCMENRDKIVALFDERFFRMWTFYLATATASFENGAMVNFQLQYARSRRALPLTRGYMDEAEAKLLA